MRRLISKRNGRVSLFLLFQGMLYAVFMLLDMVGGHSSLSIGIKFLTIILCFFYALTAWDKGVFIYYKRIHEGKKQIFSLILLQIALFCTMISDLLILILDYYLYGVLTFILVQELYGLRLIVLKTAEVKSSEREASIQLQWVDKRVILIDFIKRVLIQIFITMPVILLLLWAGIIPEALLIFSVFYFVCILSNVVTAAAAAIKYRFNKGRVIYAAGMLLFLLCDINVGLFNMVGYVVVPENIYHILFSLSSILMWAFYTPAQVLIAVSSKYSYA